MCCFGPKQGRAGIVLLTVWYIHFSLWSRRLCSSVTSVRLLSTVVTDNEYLGR